MSKYRIGVLHHGGENDVWGSVGTTYYLSKALARLGHEVYRISVTEHQDYPRLLSKKTDFIICEGVPEWQVPKGVWDTTEKKIFWWLSDLFYNVDTIVESNFDAFAVNSDAYLQLLDKGKIAVRIDLAVDRDFYKGKYTDMYRSDFVYVGNYPHKTKKQMDFMFLNAAKVGSLNLWGQGWDKSPYASFYQAPINYRNLRDLYKSSKISLLLTEKRQKKRGMINNRVYEVLGSGCLALSERYDELEKSDLGRFITFVDNEDDFWDAIYNYESESTQNKIMRAQKYVLQNHNYDIRAKHFIELYEELKGKQ